MNRRSSSLRPGTRAFTLVEMIITLAVFVLLSAAIFGIVVGVLQSSSTLRDNQNRGDEMTALKAFLKRQLSSLPGQSILASYRRSTGEGSQQTGVIFGTSMVLNAIDAKTQPNGLYTLRLATFQSDGSGADIFQTFERALTSDDASLTWTDLIHDLRQVSWRFEDGTTTQWADIWNNTQPKPNLVELSAQLAGDLRPTTMEFWIPPVIPMTSPASSTNPPATNAAP